MKQYANKAMYIEGSTTIITMMNKQGRGAYFGQSPYRLKKEYPSAIFMSFDEVVKRVEEANENKYCTQPRPITEEDFWNGLEELPPEDWKHYCNGEYFHSPEMYTSDISRCYFRVRVDGKDFFFSCLNRVHRKQELYNKAWDMVIEGIS